MLKSLTGALRARHRRPSPALMLATLAIVLATTGVGIAAIPDGGGVIHACYATKAPILGLGPAQGDLRVIDTAAGQKCATGESPLSIAQTGAPGPKGDTGATGPGGPAGPQGVQGPAGSSTISGYEIVQRSENVPSGSSAVVSAPCPPGKKVLGGSARTDTFQDETGSPIREQPDFDGSGWAAVTTNNTGGAETLEARAICANAG